MEEIITYEQNQQIFISEKTQRFAGLDFFKIICAFLVVCIHIPVYYVGDWVVAVARVAVPFFFMVTGFFFPVEFNKKKQKKQLKKILVLTVFANILYFMIFFALSAIKGELAAFFSERFTLNKLINFICLNDAFAGAHVWYLNALLYCLVGLYILTKYIQIKRIYFLIPVLLVVNIAIQILANIFPMSILNNLLLTRNFLLTGLPFILLGNYIRSKEINIKKRVLGVLVVLFVILTVLEKALFNYVFGFRDNELWVSSILLAISLFLFALKMKSENKAVLFLSKCGRDYSSIIYIIHIFIILGISVVLNSVGLGIINTIYNFTGTFIVFGVSLIVAYLYVLMVKTIKAKRELKKNDPAKG